jgi:hypothetical protein
MHRVDPERLLGMKRLAVQVTAMLPGDPDEAMLVLGLAGDVVEKFLESAPADELERPKPVAPGFWLGIGVIGVAILIFILDALTPPIVPFAVLYSGVVMVAGIFVTGPLLIFAVAACMALSCGDYLLFPKEATNIVSLGNLLLCFAVIVIGAYAGARVRRAELAARAAKADLVRSARRRLPGPVPDNLIRLTRVDAG